MKMISGGLSFLLTLFAAAAFGEPPQAMPTPTPATPRPTPAVDTSGLPSLQKYLPNGFTFDNSGKPVENPAEWDRNHNELGTLYTPSHPGLKGEAVQIFQFHGRTTDVVAFGNSQQPVAAQFDQQGKVISITFCPLLYTGHCVTAEKYSCGSLKRSFGVKDYRFVITRAIGCVEATNSQNHPEHEQNLAFRQNLENISKVNDKVHGLDWFFKDKKVKGKPMQVSDLQDAFAKLGNFDSRNSDLVDLAIMCDAAFGNDAEDLKYTDNPRPFRIEIGNASGGTH